jgi:ATP-dependent Clp protease ATP-binding subunit ClpA
MATLGQFTDRVRAVVRLSEDEAAQLGHRYYGTEHLLLAIVREGKGKAAQVLADMGVTLPVARDAVEAVLKPGNEYALLYTGRAPGYEKALTSAISRSRKLGHHFNGTEHLLLAIASADHSVAASVLRHLDINLDQLCFRTTAIIDPDRNAELGNPAILIEDVGLELADPVKTSRVGGWLEYMIYRGRVRETETIFRFGVRAHEEAQRLGHSWIGTEHLLLALLAERESTAARLLEGSGVTRTGARSAVEALFGAWSGEEIIGRRDQSRRLAAVITDALQWSDHDHDQLANSQHVLQTMLSQDDGGSGLRVLDHLGVDRASLRARVVSVVQADEPRPDSP